MKTIFLTEDELKHLFAEERQSLIKELVMTLGLSKQVKKLSAKGAAEFLGVSLSTLYKRIDRLPHKKFGKKLIFSTDELEKVCIGSVKLDKGISGDSLYNIPRSVSLTESSERK